MQSFDSLTGLYKFSFFNLSTNTIIAGAADNHMKKRVVMKKGNKKRKKKMEENENDDAELLQIVGDWMRIYE